MATIKSKLLYMPYAQATVIHNDWGVTLRSYQTDVAHIDNEGWLFINGLYSMTTRRHITAFLKEYANMGFSTAKLLVEQKMKINIHTGEVVEL
jgi:hypothetical protein